MNLKKTNKVLCITLLIFSAFTFATYQTSQSKYIKDEDSLFYSLRLENLYIGENRSLALTSGNNYKKVNFKVSFNRSKQMVDSDTMDTYTFSVKQSSCNITKVVSKGTTKITGNSAKISYSSKGEEKIDVIYSCNVEDIVKNISGEEYLYTSFEVSEVFSPENKKFLYTDGESVMSLSDYYERYPIPTATISDDLKTLTLPVDQGDKYLEIENWINLFATTYATEYASDLTKYFKTVYASEADVINLSKSLRGLTISKGGDEFNNEIYIYTLDDNFAGYARTEVKSPVNNYMMYFSNPDLSKSEAEEIFNYYLDRYLYSKTSKEYNDIQTYLNKVGGIGTIILDPTKKIAGISYYPEKQQIIIDENILIIVDSVLNKKIKIEYDTSNALKMFIALSGSLSTAYPDMNSNIITAIQNDMKVFNSVTQTNKAFSDYFYYTSGSDYVLLRIYSNGSECNYAILEEIKSGNDIELEFLKTRTDLFNYIKTTLGYIDTSLGTLYANQFTEDMLLASGTYGIFTITVSDIINIKFNLS